MSADLCHNGHPFVPGVSTDHAPGTSDSRWCNVCGEARRCWRSECRDGCYYADVCSLSPRPSPPAASCAHGWPEGDCPACAACAACDGRCGACPYVVRRGAR